MKYKCCQKICLSKSLQSTFIAVPEAVKVDIVVVIVEEHEGEEGVEGVDGHDEQHTHDPALLVGA